MILKDDGIPKLSAAPHAVGLSAKRLARISATTQQFIDDRQLAGAVTVVARRGRIAHLEAYGMMDIEANKPMQRDTIFRIYSMTKPIAAAAVMLLCEEGKLQLDAPASTYLPALGELKVAAAADAETLTLVEADRDITVRDLMRHTSGLPGAAQYMAGQTAVDKRYREESLHLLHECNLQEMVERLGRIPLLYQPGAKWHYSIAADVLGRLIEVVSGQPFDVFLSERIFQPLGMVDTGFYVPAEKVDRLAGMYGPTSEGSLQVIDAPGGGTGHVSENSFIEKPKFLSAGGGLVSTAADFSRFCLMLSCKGVLAEKRLMNFKHAALMQGQGFENVGDETLFWYAPWPEQLSNGVRIATWQRDRLGYFQTADTPRKTAQPRHVISAPIDLEGQSCTISLNVDGLSEHSQVTVDILDKYFQPVKGYSSKDCLPLTSGFHEKVKWKRGEWVKGKETIRIRLNYAGLRPEDPKVYAIYVEKAQTS